MDIGISSRERIRLFFVWPSVWLACTAVAALFLPFFYGAGLAGVVAVGVGYLLALYCLRRLIWLTPVRRLRTQPGWYLLATSALLAVLFAPCCLGTGLVASLVLGAVH